MPSIITITFSPCIDKSTTVPSLIPEKKLKCSEPKLEPGGGGINVARAIKKLGGKATAIFPSGGYTGKFFNHLIEKEGVPSVIIRTSKETRENIIVLEKSSNNQYRFGMPGTPLKEKEWRQCLHAVERSRDVRFIVASGSLPPGVSPDIYAQLSRISKKKKAKLVIDSTGEGLKYAVKEGVYLVKPNLGELAELAGMDSVTLTEAERLAKDIIQNSKCRIIVVSLGKDGALLVTKKETYLSKAPDVTQQSTVGAGDSMLAGMVYSLSKGRKLPQVLKYGIACGTAAIMNPGTELCRKNDVDRLYALMSNE